MQVLSLFSGIGAFEKALDNLGVDYTLVNFCEFDKYAVKSYCAIHNVDESKNLGDVTKVDETKIQTDLDLLTYGFPCQDISLAGKQKGLFNSDGSQTRSGLFFEALRIIEATKPKIAIAENVKNLVGKKFNAQFQIVLASLEAAGYNNYWAVLNSKNYGVPQNRERVFIVSVREDVDNGRFEFPEPFTLKKKLEDLLEDVVDEKYFLSEKAIEKITRHNNKIINSDTPEISNTIHAGYYKKGGRDQQYVKSPRILVWDGFNQRVRVDSTVIGTLTQNCGANLRRNGQGIIESTDGGDYIRNLTPKECFRLMGFDDESFHRAESVCSNTQLYKQAGNSIVVPVIENIYRNLIDCGILKGERKMELQIYSPTEDGFIKAIEWNHEEIKAEVAERVKHYSSLVYTEDQVKIAKADRAKLRKFVEVLEAKRKEIKKQCLAPYEAFEKQLKEIVAIVNEPIALIDGQCQEFEDKRKAEKKEAIMAYWYTALEENKIPAGITFEHLFDEKWLNASVKMTAVCKEFNAKLEQIEKDLATLAELPEFGFEAAEVYKSTLDLNKAIEAGKHLAEIQKRKAEAARKAEEDSAAKAGEATFTDAPDVSATAPEKSWIGFEALLSTEDALALRDFFKARGIEYKAI